MRLLVSSVGSGEPLLVDIVKLTYDKGYCLMLELLAAPCSNPRIWTRKTVGTHVQHIIIRAVPTHVVRTEYESTGNKLNSQMS